MMTDKNIKLIRRLYMDASAFEGLFEVVDRLHDAASAGTLTEVTDLDPAEVIGWLRDIAYTVNETVREIECPTADEDASDAYLAGLESVMSHGGFNA